MAKPGEVTHLFAELTSLEELGSLLGRSARLKYTCLSVSKKYLALGSNSGGVYIFSRDTLKYLQVVFGGTEANLVVDVSLSPSDHLLAIALSTGHVAVFELNIDKRVKPERVRYTQEHVGHTVTALIWDETSSKLFVGDSVGDISVILVPTNKGKNLFTIPSELISHLETTVFQMEWWKDKLLVSTITHTHLFDTIKRNFSTIGTKSRNGEFGSCFYLEPSSKCPVIYCARPGSRIWEVDFDGKVLNTHQLKQLLCVPPVPVIKIGSNNFELSTTPHTGHSVSFYKMFHISQYIITWSSKGVYLFDPVNVRVVIWTQSITGIKDMSVYNNDIYLFLENSSVHRLTLFPIYQLFSVLSSRGLWTLSANLLLAADQIGMRQAVIKRIKKDLLQNILTGLKMEGKNDIVEKVMISLEDISEGSIDSFEAEDDFMDSAEVKGHTYLPSGMVVVNEGILFNKKQLEKKDTKVISLDKLENTGSVEIGTADREKYKHEKYSELVDKAEHTYNCENNKMIHERTNSGNIHEQIKNDLFNESKIEYGNVINSPDDARLDLDKGFNSHYLQNQQLHSLVNADKTFGDSSNSDINLENNLFTKINDFTEENGSSPLQDCDQWNKLTHGDSTSEYNPVNENMISGSDNVLNQNVQTSHSDVSPQHCIVNGWSRSTDSSFGTTECALFNKEIKSSQQNTNTGLHFHSEEVITESNIFNNRNNNYELALSGIISTTPHLMSSEIAEFSNVSSYCESSPSDYSKKGTDTSHIHIFSEKPQTEDISYFSIRSFEDVKLLSACSELEIKSVDDSEIFEPNSTQKALPVCTEPDYTINAMATFNSEDLIREKVDEPRTLPLLSVLNADDSDIAKPVKLSKKKKKKLTGGIYSTSLDIDSTNKAKTIRKTISVSDDLSTHFMQGLDLEMDSISIGTVSSIEDEYSVASVDSLSITSNLEIRKNSSTLTLASDLSISPPEITGKSSSRRSSTSSYYEDRKQEVIPPLINRLAAARGSPNNDDISPGLTLDSPLVSPRSDQFFLVGSPKASLSALKDGLSLKLKTQTKSIIKTLQEKNLLIKSSTPQSFSSFSQQFDKSPNEIASQQTQNSHEVVAADELNSAKNSAIEAANISDLYITALGIQKLLKTSAIINPVLLKTALDEWSKQLNLAMFRYHKELLKKSSELQRIEKEIKSSSGNNQNLEEIDRTPRNNDQNINQFFNIGSNTSAFQDHFNTAISQSYTTSLESSTAADVTGCLSVEHSSSETIDSKQHMNPSPTYWTSVIHLDDPFKLSKEHLKLFRKLTTMSFLCGLSGDILNNLNFTDETHYRTFVKSVLPPSVYSMFTPSYESILTLFSKSLLLCKEPGHHHINDDNHKAELMPQTILNKSSVAQDVNIIFKNSGKSPKDDISKETGNVSLFFETTNINSPEHDKIPNHCLYKSNIEMWSENEQFKKDTSLALFIRLFFFVLDYNKVKQALDSHNTMVITWASLVFCSRGEYRFEKFFFSFFLPLLLFIHMKFVYICKVVSCMNPTVYCSSCRDP